MQQRYISELPTLVLSDLKRAALFFDEVIACYWFDHRGVYCGMSQDGLLDFQSPVDVYHDFVALIESGVNMKFCTSRTTRRTPYLEENLFDYDTELILNGVTESLREDGRLVIGNWDACGRYDETLAKSEVGRGGTWKYREDAFRESLRKVKNSIGSHDLFGWGLESRQDGDKSVDITLANISLVDTDNLEWSQIAEIRNDQQALADLRKLRRFLISEMQGFSLSYVEDELAIALDKHEAAAKKWGIKRLPGEISVDYEASVGVGLLTALCVAVTGSSLSTAAAIGAIAPLGQALVSINRGRKKFLENSKVGYLARIRQFTNKS